MKVMNIIQDSIVDGVGLRTVIFFSGCPHQCFGCHNPQSWNASNGTDMTMEEILEQISPMNNVTLSGGEPFLQAKAIVPLVKALKDKGKTVWCFTGYLYEDVKDQELMKYIDVLVDGKFEIDKRDLDLVYKGSSNQRIISVKRSIEGKQVVLWSGKKDSTII
ncbi:anaerobic ribonucleoside-triphosphate reductase activating protein [Paenibacillus odorifer]|uniref:anaerobic ribonucleoside-triphosphate reductase activating protein n=1 Tax=Paenibacillus odorifer TaxID=189426 RepID=UPI00096F7A41|nr:anaerobic ribonucleoside-triphosphate reductase activating protein [Paenibacillus odorifer]OME54069.1 anaerobic ribonucleoside-triphosphate reductase activating protein [Paenibacillus odorifer]